MLEVDDDDGAGSTVVVVVETGESVDTTSAAVPSSIVELLKAYGHVPLG